MRRIRTYSDVAAADHDVLDQVADQERRLSLRLERVGRVVAVASGKGGVGKSAVTANLAAALAVDGFRVGALDADLNGPSLARMLDVVGGELRDGAEGVVPPRGAGGVVVMSMELLQESADAPLRWREPAGHRFLWQSTLEGGALREFLSDVAWGELDLLLVDVPPGVDKIARLLDLLPELDAVLLVTTPSEMARAVVARSVRLVEEAGVPVVGLVANMTHTVCRDCGGTVPLFEGDGVDRLARESGLDVWARIPFDPRLAADTDAGRPAALETAPSEAAATFRALARRLVERVPPPVRPAPVPPAEGHPLAGEGRPPAGEERP